jgi:hypothetical protein
MKLRVAVEDSLTNIARSLKDSGYEVVDLNHNKLDNVSAVVVSGIDDNMMAMQDIKTKAPVINARGLTAEEVRSEIEKRYS